MPEPFKSTDEFLGLFDIDKNQRFFDPIHLNDTRVGFSVKSNYPEGCNFTPARNKHGEPDDVIALWVVYEHPEDYERNTDTSRIPIRIRAENMSLYRQKHWDYDFDDDDSPDEEEIEKSNSSPQPIGLNFVDDFFYDHDSSAFIDKDGRKFSGSEMLEKATDLFLDTVHPFRSFKLRMQIKAKTNLESSISALISITEYVLTTALGRTLEPDAASFRYFSGYKRDALKKLNEDTLDIFGYKAAKPVIITFSIAVVLFSILRYATDTSGGYLAHISSSGLLAGLHALAALWFLDTIAPVAVFWLLNRLIRLRTKVMYLTFKFW